MRQVNALWGNVKQVNTIINASGCQVTHNEGLIYDVGASSFPIKNVKYTAEATQVTLAYPDDEYDRIDVVYGDNTGAIGVLTGVASENPLHPTIDPQTQYELSFIIVKAKSHYITTRWVTTSYGSCVLNGSSENTGWQNVDQKEQQKIDDGDWTDTGETRTRKIYNPENCPIPELPLLHAHVSVDQVSYDFANEEALPTSEGVFHSFSNPIDDDYNFMFISIRAGKTLTVLNAMNVDISSQFVSVGSDIRTGYYDNTIYKLKNAFNTEFPATFQFKIS